jgi:hypothetical protein
MAKFRKKPVVIEAVQWFPPGDGRHLKFPWEVGCDVGAARVGTIIQQPWDNIKDGLKAYTIKTLEGWIELSSGDWVITGVKGEKYPCKPEIFAMTYEPVQENHEEAKGI